MNRLLSYSKINKIGAAAFCLGGLLTGALALAANPHFLAVSAVIDTANNEIDVQGRVAGIGEQTLTIKATVIGTSTDSCTNPSGKKKPAGRNRFQAQGLAQIDPDNRDENGTVPFNLPIPIPDAGPVDGAPACPNPSWTQDRVVVVQSVEVLLIQNGREFDEATCTFAAGSTVATCVIR